MNKRDFNTAAHTWDEKPARLELAFQIASGIRNAIPLRPDMEVLDFGCGTGLISLDLAKDVARVTGADSSSGMLEVLQSKCQSLGVTNVTARLIDNDAGLDFTGAYNLIVSSMTFHHVPDIRRILGQMYALTAPDGYIAIADLDEDGGHFHEDPAGVHHRGFNRQAVAGLFQDAGYSGIETCTVAEVKKRAVDGVLRSFSVFLATAHKSATQPE